MGIEVHMHPRAGVVAAGEYDTYTKLRISSAAVGIDKALAQEFESSYTSGAFTHVYGGVQDLWGVKPQLSLLYNNNGSLGVEWQGRGEDITSSGPRSIDMYEIEMRVTSDESAMLAAM